MQTLSSVMSADVVDSSYENFKFRRGIKEIMECLHLVGHKA